MKKISAFITAFAAGAAFTGCTFGASIDTLMAPPKLSVEQEQIYSALTAAHGTAISLKYPKSGKYLSAFIIEDIDGDGGNEALVFYERDNHAADENPLRINILDKKENGEWWSVDDIGAAGSEIEEVTISKLGSNSRVNLIVGTSLMNRSEKNVNIYVYSDNKLQEPPKFSDSDSYSFIDVKDLDMDGELELLRLTKASNGVPAMAEAYKLDENGAYHRAPLELSENFSEFDVSYGKMGNSKMGLYIDAISGTGSIQTDVIYMSSGSLRKVFRNPEESEATIRPAGCTCFDVDGDGSPEIPVPSVAPGYEVKAEGEQLRLTDWMQINDNYRMEKQYTSYYSVNDGYIFLFPEKWVGRVTVKRDIVNDEIVFCAYDGNGMGRELLHIFCAEDQPSREDRISGGYMLMHTKGDSSYLALIPSNPDVDNDGLTITAGDAAVGFRFRD
ncbi:hypothetical protein [Ruminococcus flavefaciens]|nr:hypothetical protein [Ruminococcus flavefaciens]